MKKTVLFLGAILLSVSALAHEHFLYTSNLDVSNLSEVKFKACFGHPGSGKENKQMNISTVDGKTHLPNSFFVVHNGEKTDLLSNVKIGKIKTNEHEATAFDITYTAQDGLKGAGSWVFFMDAGAGKDKETSFYPTLKIIVTKDSAGNDYYKRVAEGYNEIVPLLNPVNAWKENVFRAKFVDKDGKPIKGARVDAVFINGEIDFEKDMWLGKNETEKVSVRVFTDDNGVFAFSPSRAGKWVIRAVELMDREKKITRDTSLVIQFK